MKKAAPFSFPGRTRVPFPVIVPSFFLPALRLRWPPSSVLRPSPLRRRRKRFRPQTRRSVGPPARARCPDFDRSSDRGLRLLRGGGGGVHFPMSRITLEISARRFTQPVLKGSGVPRRKGPVHRRRRPESAGRGRAARWLRCGLRWRRARPRPRSTAAAARVGAGSALARRSSPLSPPPTSALSHRVLRSTEGKSKRRRTAFSNKSELASLLPCPLAPQSVSLWWPDSTPHRRSLGKSSHISFGSTYPSASHSLARSLASLAFPEQSRGGAWIM